MEDVANLLENARSSDDLNYFNALYKAYELETKVFLQELDHHESRLRFVGAGLCQILPMAELQSKELSVTPALGRWFAQILWQEYRTIGTFFIERLLLPVAWGQRIEKKLSTPALRSRKRWIEVLLMAVSGGSNEAAALAQILNDLASKKLLQPKLDVRQFEQDLAAAIEVRASEARSREGAIQNQVASFVPADAMTRIT